MSIKETLILSCLFSCICGVIVFIYLPEIGMASATSWYSTIALDNMMTSVVATAVNESTESPQSTTNTLDVISTTAQGRVVNGQHIGII